MAQYRIGVLRGGISGESDISLKTGSAVLVHMPEKYEPVDVVIDRDGIWYEDGRERAPEMIFSRLDCAFNALHGYYGEDGKVQKLLEYFCVPYTGTRTVGSAVGMNKALAKQAFSAHGLKTPAHAVLFEKEDDALLEREIMEAFRRVPHPVIVKPVDGGSSLGVRITRDFSSFREAVLETLAATHAALAEEYIIGREATCGILDEFRGERHYALPPVEIIPPPDRAFFDYEVKYSGATREVCPGNFSREQKNEIMAMARKAHEALGLRHYSRADFIVSPRGVYVLEVNTLPGLSAESLLPKACNAVGLSFSDFLDHTITLALGK